jgi:CheY-like chemotaxis protein
MMTTNIALTSNVMADGSAELANPRIRAPNIMIVEYSLPLRQALSAYLHNCGLTVMDVGTAVDALQRLKNPLVKIDLVFTDMDLTGDMDGFSLANWLRRNRPATPVLLAIRGTAETIKLADITAAGEPFFIKPYDFGRVAKRIDQILLARKRR